MDDLLEPSASTSISHSDPEKVEDAEMSSGDEDEGLDWTKLLPSSTSRPVIPKRGDKEFEPSVQGGSGLQRHVLDRSRNAMLEALKAERNTSSKSISYGIWYPSLARTHVTTARGIHFTTMGHSVPRPVPSPSPNSQQQKTAKRLELLPEEAIYLVERGSMFCWKAVADENGSVNTSEGLEDMEGVPMSVQQVFTEMIGQDGLTLEKYQVFAYLKRLGYVVMRTKSPSPAYVTAAPYTPPPPLATSLFAKTLQIFQAAIRRLLRIVSNSSTLWRPSLFHHGMSYPAIFKALRLLPSGHSTPLHVKHSQGEPSSPYDIFFNVYKPATPFKKTAPPKPDFQVVVVNARTTPIPTLSELTGLFEVLPKLPPPVPRRRISYAEQKKQAQEKPSPRPAVPVEAAVINAPQALPSTLKWLLSWISPTVQSPATSSPQDRKPNPFAVLKQGKKMVVIAAVDAGMVSFFSFRQGGFEELPMM